MPERANRNVSRIDPQIAKAARKSGVPDGSIYDLTSTDHTRPGNLSIAYAIAIVGGVLAVVLFFTLR